MIIKTLAENTCNSDKFKSVHGLSFYIETKKHKILFDVGPDETFIKNAEELNVNLVDIDTVIISHGHNDHGGALNLFLDINQKANIYVQKNIFDAHFAGVEEGLENIGLDAGLSNNGRFIFVDNTCDIDEELFIFSEIKGRKYFSTANSVLYAEIDGKIIHDDFIHEQCLVITENGEKTLIGGCAHNGIVNIMERAVELGITPKNVISGFHLCIPRENKSEKAELVLFIAIELLSYPAQYYTCHCTGMESYNILKAAMKERINYVSAGTCIEL